MNCNKNTTKQNSNAHMLFITIIAFICLMYFCLYISLNWQVMNVVIIIKKIKIKTSWRAGDTKHDKPTPLGTGMWLPPTQPHPWKWGWGQQQCPSTHWRTSNPTRDCRCISWKAYWFQCQQAREGLCTPGESWLPPPPTLPIFPECWGGGAPCSCQGWEGERCIGGTLLNQVPRHG